MKKTTRIALTKRLPALLMALMTTLTLVYATTSEANAAPALRPGVYILYTMNKTTCINDQFDDGAGGKVVVDTFDGQGNEIWVVSAVGTTDYVTIAPWNHKNCYLKAAGRDEPVTLAKGIPSDKSCQWKPVYVGNNQYVFINRQTGYALDCRCGNINQVGEVYLTFDRNGFAEAQSVYPVCISHFTNQLAPGNRVDFGSATGSLRPSANRDQAANAQFAKGVGANIVLDPFNSQTNEIVQIIPRGNKLVSIHFKHASNAALAPSDIFPDSGLTLKTYRSNDKSCLWEVYQVNGGLSFRNAQTLLMWDNYCAGGHTGNAQIQYSYNGDMAQVYYLNIQVNSSSSSSVPTGTTSMTNALYKINTSGSKLTCGFNGYTKPQGKADIPDHHEGIDFQYSRTAGTKIYSLTDGRITNVVEKAGSSGLSTIAVYNAAANKTVVYLHSNPDDSLYIGKYISRGDLIGTENSRGSGSVVHTHVEVRNGELTGAAKSLDDPVLNNSDPTAFWNSQGYTVR